MLVKYRANVADFVFERGSWVSNWVRGRTLGLTLGSFAGGSRGGQTRWAGATQTQIDDAKAELDCPVRLQVLKGAGDIKSMGGRVGSP